MPFEPMTETRAARLLSQGGLGATPAAVAELVAMGGDAWFDAQRALPTGPSLWAWARERGYEQRHFARGDAGLDAALWWRLVTAPDVLRQRVVLALSEIFVVSPSNMVAYWRQFGCMAWWELLERHCFGNFRDLLRHVTLSPAMGVYLSLRGSARADDSGRRPDENYARELLQLFTIGLQVLNLDGSVRQPVQEAYDADTVSSLARLLTGWEVAGYNALDPEGPFAYWQEPMTQRSERHDTAGATLFGVDIPAGLSGEEALERVLDAIFQHPNVAPFIARQLIQRLVTSNPSRAYVKRVAQAFENNGAEVPERGDLATVVRAVLSDPEARPAPDRFPAPGGPLLTDGKLREPMLRLVHWARLTRLSSTDGQWRFPDLSGAELLGQAPLRAPSVFNFFRPGHVPPGTEMAARGLVAPEFQITNESTAIGYVNFMLRVMPFGANGLLPSYEEWLPLADDVPALVDKLNLCLCGGMLSEASVRTLVTGVQGVLGQSPNDRLNRVIAAFFLTMAAPEYLVQR